MFVSKLALSLLPLGLMTITQTVQADVATCNAPEAVRSFKAVADDALQLLPRLDANVDKCFNPSRASYIQKTHQIIQTLGTQLNKSRNSVSAGYKQGDADALANAIIAAASAPVFSNAGNLTRYGFTTSDAR